ncbi:MAG TPA: twin-arginine translocase TatA/TatE family subunit [Acidimicrobiales bacterium]|nr:twin-arginine translocase TatA/TatE family subunit [Acidimicrobiales bacterium]
MLPGLGPAHLAVVALVALLVLGPDKLPELAQRGGRAYRDLKRLREHLSLDLDDLLGDDDAASRQPCEPEPVPTRPAPRPPPTVGLRGAVRPARHIAPSCRAIES